MMKEGKQAMARGSHPWLSRCLGGGFFLLVLTALAMCLSDPALFSQQVPWVAPSLPGGRKRVVYSSPELVMKPFYVGKVEGFSVAMHPPTVIFSYLPGQDYRPRGADPVWSHWGQGIVINGKYYLGYGDHDLTGHIVEWDPETGESRVVVDVTKFLNLPKEYYTPGNLHSYLTLGKDGWLYYSTGDEIPEAYIYNGDWILRTRPETGKTEIVAQGPAGPYSVPNGFADPKRMIFFGTGEQQAVFFAYDLVNRRLLYKSPLGEGADRGMPYAESTGRIYYRGNWLEPFRKRLDNLLPEVDDLFGRENPHPWGIMRRWDVKSGKVIEIKTECNPRAAAPESREGAVWIASNDGKLWKLDVATETFTPVANLAVMSQSYITSLVMDSTGRYLYYSPGAHGTACNNGTPIFQYDVKTGRVKAICFLTPATLTMGAGFVCAGTYSMALSEDDSTLFATWNGFRPAFPDLVGGVEPSGVIRSWWPSRSWDVCAVTAIRIPPEERIP